MATLHYDVFGSIARRSKQEEKDEKARRTPPRTLLGATLNLRSPADIESRDVESRAKTARRGRKTGGRKYRPNHADGRKK